MTTALDATSAYDQAFSGKPARVIDQRGASRPFDVPTWSARPDLTDHALFVEPCAGSTLDVGCGPGRLVAEIASRGFVAMGIDISSEAVRLTRRRGAHALHQDVFSEIPREGSWEFALLADGNLGIGGDPVLLLSRLRTILRPAGRIVAEIDPHGAGYIREKRRLQIEGRLSDPFDWAVVGADAIGHVAAAAGLRVERIRSVGGRHAAILTGDQR